MTEQDWLTAGRLDGMTLHPVWRDTRRRRLLGCAAVRRFLGLLTDPRFPAAVGAAEQFADREIDWRALKYGPRKDVTAAARDQDATLGRRGRAVRQAGWAVQAVTCQENYLAALDLTRYTAAALKPRDQAEAVDREATAHAHLFRDIFGNPFRPVTFSPEWRTDTVIALARGMYDARDFGIMPVLADALDDAGCDQPDILSHCRNPHQVHVRGCWVVDLVLGKS